MVTLVNLRAYWRFLVVLYQFFPLIVAYTRDKRKYILFGGTRRVSTEMRVKRAEVLLESLLTLGPTFIKLGQLLSTRPDILPPQYIDVLGSLQDDVPPAPWSESKVVLEEELGPVDEAFDSFDSDPISGASLGQVYVAEYEGEKVAVKIRRPGIEELVEADLRVIRWSLPLLMRFIGQSRAFSLENLADEFAKTIREEMDYDEEAETLRQIQENFEDDDTLVIPEPIEERSDDRVLTMEYLPGTKINNVAALDELGIDRTELATNLQRTYLQMIVEDGVFHADPHPGNLSVTDDGRIIFYDFGMHGEVDPFIQEKIVEFYIAVANQDVDAILDTLIEMGTLSPNVDRQVMGDVMELAIADARGDDIEQYRVNQILEQVESTIYEFPLRLPRNLALVLRVAGVVEGVCVTLDPNFDFISVATDYLTEQGYREESIQKIIEGFGQQTQQTAQSLVRVPPKLERVLDRADRDNLTVNVRLEDNKGIFDRLAKRLIYGIFLSFGFVSTVIIYALNPENLTAVGAAGVPTAVVAVLLWRSFRGRKGIRATPQFTRQNLRQQREE
ncbi:AarF/ABC1/UbiB kinase family protein [Haloferax mediterranei ATCC 33500]|uniref:AarF/ABC1/UbiB kinase family protein n=1 Tax=Haloferax mediterranei (strain ATCC 33500 / DSM 1411 / JCM 8866 / NBRC 14739 / NCIMB 2177 / R-4) TaxID=523841 RepID=I3R6Y9_HALMT|nr:AarF/ABC1/UbiB kinase family protein [Haloferax mediterranei]AFK19999.1 ubiquinone biosynthesis transmembrane protein [Haloferax mediterranei ATCC 33500]AHZ23378.1 membrane protein [Haloferax mediterranei ATCC 33500]ELZ99546.1 ubiquinone biosynthesis transmembrane protein [Haloferax mediterranei ATCC 33500]MDX5987248.1 AarF/ABC1/UbiB kinase family protein [Haloferax mediterranei ATCC 33500]QCQ73770.1 AarF/ABC1/UbiB kinase family protein [Haloferax mediterranei ATCC 33500]